MIHTKQTHLTRGILIDSDPSSSKALSRYLERFAFTIASGTSAFELRQLLQTQSFDLVIMDMHLPDEDGLSVCRWMQSEMPHLPLIVLTAHNDVASRVVSLECGADDYIERPVDARELVARIRAVLRRAGHGATMAPNSDASALRSVQFAGWQLNLLTQALQSPEGEVTVLSNLEFRLLSAFVSKPRTVLSRSELALSARHRGAQAEVRAVDLAVSRLRQKLGDAPPRQTLIRTVRGQGYILDATVMSGTGPL